MDLNFTKIKVTNVNNNQIEIPCIGIPPTNDYATVEKLKNIYDWTKDNAGSVYTEHTLCYSHSTTYYWGGAEGSIDGDYYSYKIPVISGKTYYLQNVRFSASNEVKALFCTSDGELATYPNVNPINTHLSSIVIPDNVSYIRVPTSAKGKYDVMVLEDSNNPATNYIPFGTCIIGHATMIKDNQVAFTNLQYNVKPHRWYGAKVNTLGDSLTAPGVWQQKLKDIMGFSEIRNYGVGGTCVTNHRGTGNTYIDRAPDMDDDADLIIVFTSINDYGVEIGTVNDTGRETIGGAANTLASLLQEKYPYSTIVFTSHPHTTGDGPNSWPYQSSDMYKEVCGYKAIPFCDLLRTSNINRQVQSSSDYFFKDTIHCTDSGYERIAQTLAGFLRGI